MVRFLYTIREGHNALTGLRPVSAAAISPNSPGAYIRRYSTAPSQGVSLTIPNQYLTAAGFSPDPGGAPITLTTAVELVVTNVQVVTSSNMVYTAGDVIGFEITWNLAAVVYGVPQLYLELGKDDSPAVRV